MRQTSLEAFSRGRLERQGGRAWVCFATNLLLGLVAHLGPSTQPRSQEQAAIGLYGNAPPLAVTGYVIFEVGTW